MSENNTLRTRDSGRFLKLLGSAWLPIALALGVVAAAGTVSNWHLKPLETANDDAERHDIKFSNFASQTLVAISFRGANLLMSDFRMATLREVDFTGADLTWVNFAGARICQTTMPDGSTCDLDCSGPYAFQPGTTEACPYLTPSH